MKAIVLVAGVGSRLRPLTDTLPKALIPVAGRPMLDHALEAFQKVEFEEVILVTGYLHEKIDAYAAQASIACRAIYNPRYDTANNYYSLLVAREAVGDAPFIKFDGDLIFRADVLSRLAEAPGDICLAMDSSVKLAAEEMKVQLDAAGRVKALSKELDPTTCAGESIGMEKVSAAISGELFDELARLDAEGLTDSYYEEAYHRLAGRGRDVRTLEVAGLPWFEIDDAHDLEEASRLFAVS